MIDCRVDWNEGISGPGAKILVGATSFFYVSQRRWRNGEGGGGGFRRWTAIGNWRNA